MKSSKSSSTPEPIKLPRKVIEGLQAVRRSGLTNMLDWRSVCLVASSLGYSEVTIFLNASRANVQSYTDSIFKGWTPIEGTNEDAV